MTLRRLVPALALALALTPALVRASAPVGVWSLVDKVTLSPDPNKPSLIRIDGTFLIANELPDYALYPGYSEPRSGYMYYSCPEGQQVTCVTEWLELSGIAGTEDNCRGWGSNAFEFNGKVRPGGEPEAGPDKWPIAMGIQVGFAPCEALKMWNGGETDSGSETGTASGETLTTAGDTGTASGETLTTAGDTGSASGETASGTAGDTGSASGDTTPPGETGGSDPGEGTAGEAGTAGETGIGGETVNPSGDDPTTGTPEGEGTAATAGDATGGTGETDPPVDDDDKACACTGDAAPGGALTSLGLLALLGLRRRRR